MTSGEWDLRALKALEEEEQAEFRAISESNLLQPPPPPTGSTYQLSSAGGRREAFHSVNPHSQSHLHLPTINECCTSSREFEFDGSDVEFLKKTVNVEAVAGSLNSFPVSSSFVHCNTERKSIRVNCGAFSSPQRNSSPVYTPPPIRRCATLSHSGQVRKHFKNLHQQCRGKEQQQQQRQNTKQHNKVASNKVGRYWSYGACGIGDTSRRSKVAVRESNGGWSSSDNNEEFEEEYAEAVHTNRRKTQLHCFDGSEERETESCSVPLKTDSFEMMRLMLCSASSAITTTPTTQLRKLRPPDVATGGGGGGGGAGITTFNENIIVLDGGNNRKYLPLSKYSMKNYQSSGSEHPTEYPVALTKPDNDNNSLMRKNTSTNAVSSDSMHLTSATSGVFRNAENEINIAASTSAIKQLFERPVADIIKGNCLNNLNETMQPPADSAAIGGMSTATIARNSHGKSDQHQTSDLCAVGMKLINDDELQHHIKHCSCSCNHMGYGNSMDYQTTGFSGLPDVTEHSNIRRTLSRQNSISANSDSAGEGSGVQKAKSSFPNASSKSTENRIKNLHNIPKSKRNVYIFALLLMATICLAIIATALAYQHYFMSPSRNSHEQRLRIVRRILKEVPLVDGHNNFAWNVRKYAHNSLELARLSNDLEHKSIWARQSWAQTDIERLKAGLMGVQVWSAYVPCEAQGLDAVQLALEQIDIIHRLADMYAKDTTLVASFQEILNARRMGLMASLIGIEGGHAIGSSLGVLRSFYSLGARYLSLTHKCDTAWAGSSSSTIENNGLSQFGKSVIKEMNRLGMMIDLAHSSDATIRDVVQLTRAPVIFSHSAARQLCNSTHNIPDDIIRLVADNGGLIMISFDSEDVTCGRSAHLLDVIAHIKYIRSIAGIQHIGIGAGYDKIEQPPIGLEDVSKYPDLLATLLEDSNWSEEDIAMLAGKNFLRVLKSVENVRDYWKRAAIQPVETTEQQPKSHCTYMSS